MAALYGINKTFSRRCFIRKEKIQLFLLPCKLFQLFSEYYITPGFTSMLEAKIYDYIAGNSLIKNYFMLVGQISFCNRSSTTFFI